MGNVVMHSCLLLSLLIALFVTLPAAHGQATKTKQLPARKTQTTATIQAVDLRFPEVMKSTGEVDLGEGFTATKNVNSIDIHIPGAFMDGLNASMASPLPLQLAAAAFTKATKANASSVDEAIERFCVNSKEGKTGAGDTVTFHTFRLPNGHKYKIFVYLNDFNGLMAIMSATP